MNELNETKKNLDSQMQKLEQISQEKDEKEEAKIQGESEIVELNKQLSEFKATIISLQESSLLQTDKFEKLESEINHYKAALDQETIEKTKIKEDLNEEKANGAKLWEKIAEMEKCIEEMEKIQCEIESENANLRGDKTELENRCAMLMKTITSLENQLSEAQKEHNNFKNKVGTGNANSERVLNLLKNTANSIVSPSNGVITDRGIDFENMVFDQEKGDDDGEEVKPYVEELEAIKKAFEGRENKIGEMKRQLEILENSAAEAHKGKGFWTLVSSATIVAAASIAYVARNH
jgi:chromosome segregation ATPase